MVRFLMKMLSLIISISLFCGCYDSRAVHTDSLDMQKEKKELTLWYYWDISINQQNLSRLVDEFNDSQDEVIIKTRYIPDEDFKKQLSLSVVRKQSPDIVLIDSSDQAYYNNMDMFMDLTDRIDYLDEYGPCVLNSCKKDGRVYGIPFGINCLALFYNEDMLKKAGCEVPKTWEQFRKTAQKLTHDNVYGFGMTALQSEESLYEFLPILWSYGGDTEKLTSTESRRSFSLLQQLINDGSMSRSVTNWTLVDLMNQFIDKKIAMMFNSPMTVETIRHEAKDLNWNVTYLPTNNNEEVSIIGGENWAVLKGENQEEALKFLKFVTDKENVQSYISSFGFLCAQKDIFKNQYEDDEVMKKFKDIYRYSRQRNVSCKWPEVSGVVSNAMINVIENSNSDMNEVMNKAADDIKEINEGE